MESKEEQRFKSYTEITPAKVINLKYIANMALTTAINKVKSDKVDNMYDDNNSKVKNEEDLTVDELIEEGRNGLKVMKKINSPIPVAIKYAATTTVYPYKKSSVKF